MENDNFENDPIFRGSTCKTEGYYSMTFEGIYCFFSTGAVRSLCGDRWLPRKYKFFRKEMNENNRYVCHTCRDVLEKQVLNVPTTSPGNEDEHYSGEIQPVDYAEAQGWAPEAYQFSIIKYVTRYQKKAGVLDLEKAKWFLEKLIKFEQNRIDTEKRKKD